MKTRSRLGLISLATLALAAFAGCGEEPKKRSHDGWLIESEFRDGGVLIFARSERAICDRALQKLAYRGWRCWQADGYIDFQFSDVRAVKVFTKFDTPRP